MPDTPAFASLRHTYQTIRAELKAKKAALVIVASDVTRDQDDRDDAEDEIDDIDEDVMLLDARFQAAVLKFNGLGTTPPSEAIIQRAEELTGEVGKAMAVTAKALAFLGILSKLLDAATTTGAPAATPAAAPAPGKTAGAAPTPAAPKK